ncbi:MAPEG family protein [Sandarakinorhabdus sp.]|uniref:MAPEG family protein n=1 Tax=Sandarakinorhabdus sp. TaxID=1916663 RepID=UPI00286E906C|nr:MAPEG family protein [Sandarakinorhabdus sp.]
MLIPATLLTAGTLGIVFFVLSLRVVQRRLAGMVSMGDGGDQRLLERIRTHGNFAEHVPFLLVLMAGIELTAGHHSPWLWITGGTLVLARISHAIGMSRPSPNAFRSVGVVVTFTLMLGLSLWALALGLGLGPSATPDFV